MRAESVCVCVCVCVCVISDRCLHWDRYFSPPLAENEGVLVGWRQKHARRSPRCPQNVMSVCVILIHPLQAASFHRHAPHKHRL